MFISVAKYLIKCSKKKKPKYLSYESKLPKLLQNISK